MGTYDTYGNTQLKVGPVEMDSYGIGDKASTAISDGIYFAPEGAVVIYKGVFVAEIPLDAVFDKWGGKIEIDVDSRNPVSRALTKMETKTKHTSGNR